MKTKLALAILALATTAAPAVTLRITHHDLTRVSFAVGDLTNPAYAPLRDEIQQGPWTSIVGISARGIGDDTTQVSINWVHSEYPMGDTFRIPLGHITFPTFHGASYQYLLDSQEWEWTYLAPIPGEGVPDGGGMLAMLGVGLRGLWRMRR